MFDTLFGKGHEEVREVGAMTFRTCILVAGLTATAVTDGGAGGGEDDAWGALGGTPSAAGPPVEVSVLPGQNAVTPGGTIDVAAVLQIGSGWHVNSRQPLEDYLIPTEVWLDDSTGVEVVEVLWPEEHRIQLEFSEVPMSVYEGYAPLGLRFRVADDVAGEVVLTGGVGWQACNDQTCAPPDEKTFELTFAVTDDPTSIQPSDAAVFGRLAFTPVAGNDATRAPPAASEDDGASASTVVETPPAGAGGEGGILDGLQRFLAENFGNPLVAFPITLLFGLLSAATPCVYPMIPITARILMGRGGDNPALGRTHAFMYFLGIILTYAILGLIAAATGGGFNQLLRIPWVILGFAVMFALLGLSMLGLFEIQIPDSVASRVDSSTSNRSGLLGTVLMGIGAGLVVSPCVGPVVVFILTQIAAQIAAIEAAGAGGLSTAGPLAYGSVLMAGYGAGLGVPFLVVGLFSSRVMAKPGGWMTTVRVVLGLVILYFAYDYFLKALDTFGVDRALSKAMAFGVVLIFLSVMWGVFRTKIDETDPHAGWAKVRLATTIILLVTGVFFLWTGLQRSGLVAGGAVMIAGGSDTASAAHAEEPGFEITKGLRWHRDFAAAKEAAADAREPIFVDFYAHWCANCKVFSRQAAAEGPLRSALEEVVLAKIYDTDDIFDEFRSDPRYPELKVGLPFFVILTADGEFVWKGTDYRDHDTFISELARARALSRDHADGGIR